MIDHAAEQTRAAWAQAHAAEAANLLAQRANETAGFSVVVSLVAALATLAAVAAAFLLQWRAERHANRLVMDAIEREATAAWSACDSAVKELTSFEAALHDLASFHPNDWRRQLAVMRAVLLRFEGQSKRVRLSKALTELRLLIEASSESISDLNRAAAKTVTEQAARGARARDIVSEMLSCGIHNDDEC